MLPSQPQMLYFVTVNYHSTDLVQQLLQSLAIAADEHCQVVIVNNSPEDAAVEALAKPDSITVVTAPGNLGFGGGCNLGMDWVYERNPTALIWLINPDTELDANAVAYVRTCLQQDSAIALLGTRIQDLEGRIWFSCGRFNPWLGSLKHRGDDGKTAAAPPGTAATDWLSGCSMLFNLAQFDHCPQFDPQYFLDYEDAEISHRYRRQGYRIRVTQAVLVKHQVSAITERYPRFKFRHATFSKLYFLYQHGTFLALALNLLYLLAKMLLLLPRQPEIALGRWQGLQDFLHRWQQGFPIPDLTFPRATVGKA
jgi:N-acetylglucosaminyl-diphospho-decaprenol L-rhamnosyltransferase